MFSNQKFRQRFFCRELTVKLLDVLFEGFKLGFDNGQAKWISSSFPLLHPIAPHPLNCLKLFVATLVCSIDELIPSPLL